MALTAFSEDYYISPIFDEHTINITGVRLEKDKIIALFAERIELCVAKICELDSSKTAKNFDKTFYSNIVFSKIKENNWGFIYIVDSSIYHVMIGNNPDGSPRIEKIYYDSTDSIIDPATLTAEDLLEINSPGLGTKSSIFSASPQPKSSSGSGSSCASPVPKSSWADMDDDSDDDYNLNPPTPDSLSSSISDLGFLNAPIIIERGYSARVSPSPTPTPVIPKRIARVAENALAPLIPPIGPVQLSEEMYEKCGMDKDELFYRRASPDLRRVDNLATYTELFATNLHPEISFDMIFSHFSPFSSFTNKKTGIHIGLTTEHRELLERFERASNEGELQIDPKEFDQIKTQTTYPLIILNRKKKTVRIIYHPLSNDGHFALLMTAITIFNLSYKPYSVKFVYYRKEFSPSDYGMHPRKPWGSNRNNFNSGAAVAASVVAPVTIPIVAPIAAPIAASVAAPESIETLVQKSSPSAAQYLSSLATRSSSTAATTQNSSAVQNSTEAKPDKTYSTTPSIRTPVKKNYNTRGGYQPRYHASRETIY